MNSTEYAEMTHLFQALEQRDAPNEGAAPTSNPRFAENAGLLKRKPHKLHTDLPSSSEWSLEFGHIHTAFILWPGALFLPSNHTMQFDGLGKAMGTDPYTYYHNLSSAEGALTR